MKSYLYVLIFIYLPMNMALSGCGTEPVSTSEFRFPILKGNIEHGRQGFVELGCNQCHTVNGVSLPAYEGEMPVSFELGGRIWNVKTYADLVTSIINPNHVVSGHYLEKIHRRGKDINSPMPFRGDMTVTQLIDIVTFLNSRYVLIKDYSPNGTGGKYLNASDRQKRNTETDPD